MKTNGFTLLELLITLVISAITLTATMIVIQQSTKNTNYLKKKVAAHCLATNLASEVQMGLRHINTQSVTQGESKLLNQTLQWTIKAYQPKGVSYQRLTIKITSKHKKLATFTAFSPNAISK